MIGLAWIASSTWVVPVLGWHYLVFGGVRQNKVTQGWNYFNKSAGVATGSDIVTTSYQSSA